MNINYNRFWCDIKIGETFDTEGITIDRKDILEFAAEFDPQPYHLDKDAADESIFGGLCASGWHVTAVMMRMLTDVFSNQRIALLGSNAVSSLDWRKPVFAGDTLSSQITVSNKSESDDNRFGYIDCDVEVVNQKTEPVIRLTTTLMIGCALAGEAEHG